jgi:tRNA threonylcarbamoyladenosine modification (KEOPS) complex  Pcc1 subunit
MANLRSKNAMTIQIDYSTCTAIDIITRSIVMHPSLFREALHARYEQDVAHMEGKEGTVLKAVRASASAALRGITAIDHGDAEGLAGDMGAGIIALNVACKLQCIPPHVRTGAALRTWGDA